MKLGTSNRLPWRRGVGAALCLVVALVSAAAAYRASPPVAGASVHVVVDAPSKLIGDGRANSDDLDTLYARAVLLSNLMTSAPVIEHVARRAGVPPEQIFAETRITANVPSVLTEPDSERRAYDIAGEALPYRLEIQPSSVLPTLNVFAQAPTVDAADRLADAVVPALDDYLDGLARERGEEGAPRMSVEQLGRAHGGIISGQARRMVTGLAFTIGFALCAVVLLVASRLRRRRAAPERPADEDEPAERDGGRPTPAWGGVLVPVGGAQQLAMAGGAVTLPARGGALALPGIVIPAARRRIGIAASAVAEHAGDWPRTTRLLPWLLAAMIGMIWLVPFNTIVLSVAFPVDLKFDRLLLPVIVATWLVTIAVGGMRAPRVRLTWIHVTLFAVAAVACLSLVLNAGALTRSLELEGGVKQLTVLASYVCLFVVVASGVRRTEVPAFLTYTLILAVICALGTLWEYRFQYNVFYEMPGKLLPGIFEVGQAESSAVDDIGRRVVRGPAEIPLEAVAMLAMGVPLALVGLMHASTWRRRILYGVATVLLLAAMMSTFRKTAFLAPAAVVLTLAYFRRRELLRLAPIGLVLVVLIPVLAPGALGSVAFQLRGDRLGVNTVSDRTSDYDAVRPDMWTHLAFGRGYGTYEHTSYRILDMELLHQVLEVGLVGLAAYLSVAAAIVAVARAPIRARSPGSAPVALAAAATAVAFLVVSTLFDVMSFPHCPYILLWMAGLLAAVLAPEEDDVGVAT